MSECPGTHRVIPSSIPPSFSLSLSPPSPPSLPPPPPLPPSLPPSLPPPLGVGLLNRLFDISNNTGLEADGQHQIGAISCHSASRDPHIGRWISPTGDDITFTTDDVFSVEFHNGSFPSYTVLSLHPGSSHSNSHFCHRYWEILVGETFKFYLLTTKLMWTWPTIHDNFIHENFLPQNFPLCRERAIASARDPSVGLTCDYSVTVM